MIDPFGRHVTYLRVSVTDRCDFRCVYCMAEDMTFLPRKEVLTLEELYALGKSFSELGVRKIRARHLLGAPARDHRHGGGRRVFWQGQEILVHVGARPR